MWNNVDVCWRGNNMTGLTKVGLNVDLKIVFTWRDNCNVAATLNINEMEIIVVVFAWK